MSSFKIIANSSRLNKKDMHYSNQAHRIGDRAVGIGAGTQPSPHVIHARIDHRPIEFRLMELAAIRLSPFNRRGVGIRRLEPPAECVVIVTDRIGLTGDGERFRRQPAPKVITHAD